MSQSLKLMERKDRKAQGEAVRDVSYSAKKTNQNDPSNLAYQYKKFVEGKK